MQDRNFYENTRRANRKQTEGRTRRGQNRTQDRTFLRGQDQFNRQNDWQDRGRRSYNEREISSPMWTNRENRSGYSNEEPYRDYEPAYEMRYRQMDQEDDRRYDNSLDNGRFQTRGDRGRADLGMERQESGRFQGKGPKNFKRSDERIREDVCQALEDHSELDATDIDVEVTDGEVILKGMVESRQAKRMAEDILEECRGVKDVRNEIRVKSGRETSEAKSGHSERTAPSLTSSQQTEGSKKQRAA